MREKEKEKWKEKKVKERKMKRVDRAREGGGYGGLDRLIYLLSDQPTYLPTNLAMWTLTKSQNVYESESDRDGVLSSKTHLVLAQGGLI